MPHRSCRYAATERVVDLGRERNGPRPTERLREPREHRQVGVKRDPFQATDAERRELVLVLQPAELALDSATASVEVAPPLRLTRDERVQPVGLDPR